MRKVIFAGVVRDCAPYLSRVLSNIDRLARYFTSSAFIFIENDSIDETKQILKFWGKKKKNFFLINLDGLYLIKQRTLRLEIARNTYIEYIKCNTFFHSYDYLVLLDMDDSNIFSISNDEFLTSLNFLDSNKSNAAVFSNQLGVYYDIWALRDNFYSPNDCWEAQLNYVLTTDASDEESFQLIFKDRVFSIDKNHEIIEVDSAFGGLGIYKMDFILKNQNPYLGSKIKVFNDKEGNIKFYRIEICEHVHFNLGIKNLGGRLFILPKLINGSNNGINFHHSFYKQIIF